MNRISIAATTGLLLLAACNKAPESADKASPAPANPLAAATMNFQPGKWQATSELVKMEVPGMPPEMAKNNLGQKTSFEHCMTPEQAARPKSDFFTKNDGTTDCTTKNFAMVGGKLDAAMACVDKKTKTEMNMTIKGDYQPTAYTATMTMVTGGAPGGGEMRIIANTSGKRIGDCDAKPAGTN
jgi:hypothetical protein